jgi:hypothetical protein
MEEIRVRRTNNEDINFIGKKLASIHYHDRSSDDITWWKLDLFKSLLGNYILSSTVRLNYIYKKDLQWAYSFPTTEDLESFLTHDGHIKGRYVKELLSSAAEKDETFAHWSKAPAPVEETDLTLELPTLPITGKEDELLKGLETI